MCDSVVLDIGSNNVRAGLACDTTPRIVLSPTVVGKPKDNDESSLLNKFALEALEHSEHFDLSYPIVEGNAIIDFNDIECLMDYVFKSKLQIPIREYKLLMTDPILNSKQARAKLAEIAFEKFGVPYFQLVSQPELSLYTAGLLSGLVLDCGHHTCTVTPIFYGVPIRTAVEQSNIAGKAVSDNLSFLLKDKCNNDQNTEDEINSIKEKLCYISLDFEREKYSVAQKPHPTKPNVQLSTELYHAPEILFLSLNQSLHKMCLKSRYNASTIIGNENSKRLLENVIIVGGSSVFPGLKERLFKETLTLAPCDVNVNITTPHQRKDASWIGGAMLASQPMFKSLWIPKTKYDEIGSSVINQYGL